MLFRTVLCQNFYILLALQAILVCCLGYSSTPTWNLVEETELGQDLLWWGGTAFTSPTDLTRSRAYFAQECLSKIQSFRFQRGCNF